MDALHKKPKYRSKLHMSAGKAYFSILRYINWRFSGPYAKACKPLLLPNVQIQHATPLLRELKGLEMQLQYNKITNLRLACARLDGLMLYPGETLSYWNVIGRPTARKGYLPGMVLVNGKVEAGVGGGLCQLSNLIYWMTLHTRLTVTERHHHGYDVFPDSSRTQPFGSGATCFYPYGDLMIYNDTDLEFQLHVQVQSDNLYGEWRAAQAPVERYRIVEKNHYFRGEYWGGFTRHNELWRQMYDLDDNYLREEYITENHVITMYEPFLEAGISN